MVVLQLRYSITLHLSPGTVSIYIAVWRIFFVVTITSFPLIIVQSMDYFAFCIFCFVHSAKNRKFTPPYIMYLIVNQLPVGS